MKCRIIIIMNYVTLFIEWSVWARQFNCGIFQEPMCESYVTLPCPEIGWIQFRIQEQGRQEI